MFNLFSNVFVDDLYEVGSKFLGGLGMIFFILSFAKYMDDINYHLYIELEPEDQFEFIRFFIKRWTGKDTATTEEINELKELFDNAETLYNSRTTVNDPINVNLGGQSIQFLSPTPVDRKPKTMEEKVLNYYEIVHSFFLNEYKLEDYEPKDGQTILDCGAFTGDSALAFRCFYPNSPIYSFECDNSNFEYLKKNIAINNFRNITPVKAFLSARTSGPNLAIDDYVGRNNIRNIGLIKFDIEGAEMAALQGAVNTITTQEPILIIPIYHLNSDCANIPKFLGELGMPMEYRIKWVEKSVWGMDCCLFAKFIQP